MTRMSQYLSARAIQPGDYNTGFPSEKSLYNVLCYLLPEEEWIVEDHPEELMHCFGQYGIKPDCKIQHIATNRIFYFEVKYQSDGGNAEERGCKLFTSRFRDFINGYFGLPYHPFNIVFTGSLAVLPRYTEKFPFYYYEDEYFCWEDTSDADSVYSWICYIIEYIMQLDTIPQNPADLGHCYNECVNYGR